MDPEELRERLVMDSQGTCDREGIINGTCSFCPPSLLQSGQCGPSQYYIDYIVQVCYCTLFLATHSIVSYLSFSSLKG